MEIKNPKTQIENEVGRWLSPDPSGMAAVSLTNPQSWNMYAYVTDNPTNLIDALGLTGGYGPGSNACTSTTDVNGQTQCQAATYAAAMAGDTNSGGCMAGEYGCQSTSDFLENGSSMGQDYVDAIAGTASPEQQYINDNCIGCYNGYSSFAVWANVLTSENLLAQDAAAIQSQIARLKANVAADHLGYLKLNYSDYKIVGGNVDVLCPGCTLAQVGRYGGGVHIPGGDRLGWIHDDTMSSYTGLSPFGLSDFLQILANPIPLVVHGTVDYGIGSLFYGDDEAIPRP